MAWRAPTKRKEYKNLLTDKRFYRLLSEQCNFSDPDTAFLVYIAVVQVVGQELRRHGVCRLPHLGDIGLVTQNPRPGWVGMSHIMMPEKKVLRFYFKDRFKRYLSKYSNGSW